MNTTSDRNDVRPKVAIVCDWLTGIGGAERVVYELHKMYPDAPIYTSQFDAKSLPEFTEADVRTGSLQKLPKSLKKFLPILRAWTFSRLDLSEYDLVISSSGAEAKGVKTGKSAVHICYCHSPTHYYWFRYDEYLENPGFPRGLNWLARLGLKIFAEPLRRWDKKAAGQPDFMIANSNHTKAMIKKYYGREADVVFPPVDVDRFKPGTAGAQANVLTTTPATTQRHGFVTAGRQTPYKRFDLAIEACDLASQPLVVIGNGPDHARLEKIEKQLKGRGTLFLTQVTDADMTNHFKTAIAFILPNMDDFGIVAVEAMAAGTPVVAFNQGGALDYVIPNKTGLFFDKQDAKTLAAVLEQVANKTFDSQAIREHAKQFSTSNFVKNMQKYINDVLKNRSS